MTSYLKTMLAGLRQWITDQKPDWNQNDETAANYIKGRPCYDTDPRMEYLVKDQTVTLETLEGAPGDWAIAKLATNISLKAGKTYTVTWDEKEYSVVGTAIEQLVIIGNMSVDGSDDTGEPFIIATISNSQSVVYGLGAGTHTFSVSTMTSEIIPLPAKYLPTIPVEKLPTIPVEKLPTIPAEKLAKTFVIKINVEAPILFASTSAYKCDFGGNTALYAAQMLRDQKAVIETTDGRRYAPCANMNFDESGDGNYITFFLVDTTDAIVKIANLAIMKDNRIGISRIIKLHET